MTQENYSFTNPWKHIVRRVTESSSLRVAGAILNDELQREGFYVWGTLKTKLARNRPQCIGVADDGVQFYKKAIKPDDCNQCLLFDATNGHCRLNINLASDSGYRPSEEEYFALPQQTIYRPDDWRSNPTVPGRRIG